MRTAAAGTEWRAVSGFDNYLVSSDGRVWVHERTVVGRDGAARTLSGQMLKGTRVGKTDHRSVHLLGSGGEYARVMIAHLVLTSFIGPRPEPDWFALRHDGDPENNSLGNLSWAPQSEKTTRAA
jgi:hypothetical protein